MLFFGKAWLCCLRPSSSATFFVDFLPIEGEDIRCRIRTSDFKLQIDMKTDLKKYHLYHKCHNLVLLRLSRQDGQT